MINELIKFYDYDFSIILNFLILMHEIIELVSLRLIHF
jgi:hypothetical protein